MHHKKALFLGIIFFLLATSFINNSVIQHASFSKVIRQPENQTFSSLDQRSYEEKALPNVIDKEFVEKVLIEAARLLGWQNYDLRFGNELYVSVNPNTGIEDYESANRFSVSFHIEEFEAGDEISAGNPNAVDFHGYTAFHGSAFQAYEISLIWNMDGYHFWVYGNNASLSGTAADIFPYAEALYQAYVNVVNGTSGGSGVPSVPDSPPSDLCANVSCRSEYCSDDGGKYLYDCACDSTDGQCYCRSDICEYGCDEFQGGCIYSEEDSCAGVTCPDAFCSEDGSEYYFDCYCDEGDCYCDSVLCDAGCDDGGCLQAYGGEPQDEICDHVVCPEDYCEADGKTRIYDCKCDPVDGECGCLVEVCESGCNAGTGQCEITMVIPADQDGTDSGSSDGGYPPSPTPEGPGLLGVIGGVAAGGGVLAGAGYLGYKAVQAALARQAAKTAAKAATKSAEPTLSELLARAEKSANRASSAIDDALKANAKDARNYREFLQRTTAQNDAWAERMAKRAKNIEWAEKGVRAVKKGADVTAELLGNVPGAGTTFKYTYNLSTTAAESIASGDSVGTVALKTTGKAMETAAGDALFGKVTLLKNLPTRMSMRTIKIATRQVGPHYLIGEGIKNEATNATMNWLKAKKSSTWFGKVEKGLTKAGKKIDTKFIKKTIRKVIYR